MWSASVQLLACVALILQSGPLAPCKLERELFGHDCCVAESQTSEATTGVACGCQNKTPENDKDRDGDSDGCGSCWCSIHVTLPDSHGFDAGPLIALPVSFLVPFISLSQDLPAHGRPVPATESPGPQVACSLPLLI